MKKLLTILVLLSVCLSAEVANKFNPVYDISTSTVAAKYTYWINGNSKKRHNSKCRYYGRTKKGYYTNSADGIACKICGG